MTGMDLPRSVLIAGVYGAGKSSLAAQVAEDMATLGLPYAALDLDWLGWFMAEPADGRAVMLRNLRAVVSNYLDVGVRYFIAAHTVRTRVEVDQLRAVLPGPTRVVRLVVPIAVIEERLRHDTGSGRVNDLAVARADVATRSGEGLEDRMMHNDRPIAEVADELRRWLGWGEREPA